jgi:hypothetical protein
MKRQHTNSLSQFCRRHETANNNNNDSKLTFLTCKTHRSKGIKEWIDGKASVSISTSKKVDLSEKEKQKIGLPSSFASWTTFFLLLSVSVFDSLQSKDSQLLLWFPYCISVQVIFFNSTFCFELRLSLSLLLSHFQSPFVSRCVIITKNILELSLSPADKLSSSLDHPTQKDHNLLSWP